MTCRFIGRVTRFLVSHQIMVTSREQLRCWGYWESYLWLRSLVCFCNIHYCLNSLSVGKHEAVYFLSTSIQTILYLFLWLRKSSSFEKGDVTLRFLDKVQVVSIFCYWRERRKWESERICVTYEYRRRAPTTRKQTDNRSFVYKSFEIRLFKHFESIVSHEAEIQRNIDHHTVPS